MQLTEQTLSTGLTRVDALLLAVLKSVICARSSRPALRCCTGAHLKTPSVSGRARRF
jgi:hypothetical protein